MRTIKFKDEKLPFDVVAFSERFAVCTRSIDLKVDKRLITSLTSEEVKNLVVYTLVDFKEGIRAPNNKTFNSYNYASKSDCDRCLKDLELGNVELSRRRKVDLLIEWSI